MKKHFLYCFFLLSYSIIFAQSYSGTYTIGGNNPDFATINIAFDSLEIKGVSGPVIFNVRPGNYVEQITIDSIPGNSNANTVVLQSEMLDSASVNIYFAPGLTSYVISVKNIQSVSFRYLTIRSTANYVFLCLNIYNSHVFVEDCHILAGDYNVNPSSSKPLIKISCDPLVQQLISIRNSDLSGAGVIIEEANRLDSLLLINNRFSKSMVHMHLYAVYGMIKGNSFDTLSHINTLSTIFNCRTLELDSNYFYSGFKGEVYCINGIVKKNNIKGKIPTFNSTHMDMRDNYFYYQVNNLNANYLNLSHNTNYSNFAHVNGDRILVDSNTIATLSISGGDSIIVSNNEITDELGISHITNSDYAIVKNNTVNTLSIFYGEVVEVFQNSVVNFDFHYVNNIQFHENKVNYGEMAYSGGSLFNNYFISDLELIYVDSIYIYHNNFGTGLIKMDFANHIESMNNNFVVDYDASPGFVSNLHSDYNNYYPSGGLSEQHSTYYDPQYINPLDPKATNPLLMGKGKNLSPLITHDIDNVLRNNPPTIGADEIYIPLSSSTIHYNIPCGNHLSLSLGNDSNEYSYSWTPTSGLSDTTISNPVITPGSNMTYIVVVSDSLHVVSSDTIVIDVSPFHVSAGPDLNQPYCGYAVQLAASYNSNAEYLWQPASVLDDSTRRTPIANPDTSIDFVVIATVPGCGISSDTVSVQVDNLPIADFYLDSLNNNYVAFLNHTTCADSYFWDFGDSTYSADENPYHLYTNPGNYLISMIACNSFGCDTFAGNLTIDSMAFNEISTLYQENIINIFPNPSTGEFHIRFSSKKESNIIIQNSGGQVIMHYDFYSTTDTETQLDINLSEEQKGIYFLRLIQNDKVLVRKLILN